MLNELPAQLARIKQQLQQLLKLQQQLEKENRLLKDALQKKEVAIQQQQQQQQELEQQLAALRLSGKTLLGDDERKALKQQIEGYLKEVEKCMALLNN